MDSTARKMKGVVVRFVGVACIALIALVFVNISRYLFHLPVPPTNFAAGTEYFSAWLIYLACQLVLLGFGLLVCFGLMKLFAKIAIKVEQEVPANKND